MTNATPTTATAAVIAALSLLLSSGLLGAVLVYFRRLVEARIGATHTAQAIAITGEAVRAAEQIGRTHGLDPQAKYSEAANRATAFLGEHGIVLSDQQLRTLIEGAVTQIKQPNGAPMPGVVLTGDNPQVNAAPPVPSGPTAEQTIAAIAAAVGALFPQSGPGPQAAPVDVVAPVSEAMPVVVTSSATPTPVALP